MGAVRYTTKSKGVSISLRSHAPTIQPSVKMNPAVVNDNINAIAPKKPTNVNRNTILEGMSPSLAKPLNRALIIMPPMIPVTTSLKPFWKSFKVYLLLL